MSALTRLKHALVGPSPDEIARVGESLWQSTEGLERRLDELRRTPDTLAQLLGAEAFARAINFKALDALLARAETIEAAATGMTFDFAGRQSLAACTERLRDVLTLAEPSREAWRQ